MSDRYDVNDEILNTLGRIETLLEPTEVLQAHIHGPYIVSEYKFEYTLPSSLKVKRVFASKLLCSTCLTEKEL